MSYTCVRENQIKTLADVLANKHGELQVRQLRVFGNKLTDEIVSYLFSRASTAFQSLTHLDLSYNRIGSESIKSIIAALTVPPSTRHTLSYLYLSDNPIGVSGLQALENATRNGILSNLECLDLKRSLTSDADTNASWLTTFVEAILNHCPRLRSLDLHQNNLDAPGATALARFISKFQCCSTDLKKLFKSPNLIQTNLGDKGLCAFVDGLEGACRFKILYLNDNGIHATGVSCLADAVCSGKIIIRGRYSRLFLNDNHLGLEGAMAVGRILCSQYCQFENLHLSNCKLTSAEASLPSTDPIKLGNNTSNEVARDAGQQLCQSLTPQNNTITFLGLDGNSFMGNGIHILVAFIYLCPCLKYLSTCNCEITSDDLIELFHTLSALKPSTPSLCGSLVSWHLNNNEISDSGVSAFIDHLPTLFPTFGCDLIGNIYLLNNPAVSNEMKKKLAKEVFRRKEVRYNAKQFYIVHSSVYTVCICGILC